MTGAPRVAVAVVSWNTRELLDRCLESLRADHEAGRAEVWVVDNASTDGSAAMVAERHPWVRLEALTENVGYGAAVNRVAAQSRTPFLAAANSDLRFEAGALSALLAAAERHPTAGSFAPRLLLPDGSTQHSLHPFPTVRTGLLLSTGAARLGPVARRLPLHGHLDPDRSREVDWAHGAFLLVRREAFQAVSGFDAEQWLYAEDLDLAWRLARGGWATRYVPGARIEHAVSAATATRWDEHERAVRTQRSAYAWMLTRRGLLATRSTALAHLVGPLARARLLGLASRVGTKWAAALEQAAATQHRYAAMHRTGLEPRSALDAHRGDRGSVTRRPLELWCDVFPVLSETFVAAEARELARLGHRLLVRTASRGDGQLDVGDVMTAYEGEASLLRMARVLARHPVRCAADLASRRRWAREEHPTPLRRLAPDVLRLAVEPSARIHVHFAGPAALSAMRVSRILGRPWSLTAHAYDIYLQPMNLREKLRDAALVTSGCDYTVRDLRRIAGEDHGNRIHRIVMGVDPERFTRCSPPATAASIIAVGRLVEKKGFVHLIRAAAEPALTGRVKRLAIIGEGPLREELAAEIARLGLEDVVVLAGARTPEQVRAALEEAAVLAMPCVVAASGDRDSMPVVVKEALAMELPVVLSDEVGLPELARPEFARLVPPGDYRALAEALAELLALSPEERGAMGRVGRAFVREHADVRQETDRLSALLSRT